MLYAVMCELLYATKYKMKIVKNTYFSLNNCQNTECCTGTVLDRLSWKNTDFGQTASISSTLFFTMDVIKTRVMNMKVEPGFPPQYNGALDCALKTVLSEGPFALFKGFMLTILGQGPFMVVLFVTLEQVRKLLKDSVTYLTMRTKSSLSRLLEHKLKDDQQIKIRTHQILGSELVLTPILLQGKRVSS